MQKSDKNCVLHSLSLFEMFHRGTFTDHVWNCIVSIYYSINCYYSTVIISAAPDTTH